MKQLVVILLALGSTGRYDQGRAAKVKEPRAQAAYFLDFEADTLYAMNEIGI